MNSMKQFFIVVVLLVPSIAFSINCPVCMNQLTCGPLRQPYCNYCEHDIFPSNLLGPRRIISLHEGGQLFYETTPVVVGHDGDNLDATSQTVLNSASLHSFHPEIIISNQNLNHLLSYLNCHYRGLRKTPRIVFSSIALAQLLMLDVPVLSQLEPAEHQIALWWLTGYWLLYMSPDTRIQAQVFLAEAPSELQLNIAQAQVISMQVYAMDMPPLPELISLFHVQNQPDNQYAFSAAMEYLTNLGENIPYLAQVNYPEGIIAVIHRAGVYHIITPYNRLISTTSIKAALQALRQIVTAKWLPSRIINAIKQTVFWSVVGAVVGGITGLYIAGAGLLNGAEAEHVLSAYFAWLGGVIYLTNRSFNEFGKDLDICDDLPEERD